VGRVSDGLTTVADLGQPQSTGGVEVLASLDVPELTTTPLGHDDALGYRVGQVRVKQEINVSLVKGGGIHTYSFSSLIQG
jgi:hypothetical protein